MAAETLGDHSDRQLVEKALAGPDEVAFQAIVQRHGPMVYRVCWRVLQHSQDAEDAFQATFLVLAQRLRTLRNHASLASWLHGVAHRVAGKARAQAAGRRCREHRAARLDALPPDDVTWGELRSALESELSHLPDKLRLPLILCYLEGRTQDEAARQLGWSKSTLRRRLEEARETLGSRLKGRGLSVPAALSAVLLSDCLASAAPRLALIASTVYAATGVAAGQAVDTVAPAKVAALTEGVLKTMLLTKLKIAMTVLVLAGFLAAGVATPVPQAQATGQTGVGKPANAGPAAKGAKRARAPMRWKERLFVESPADKRQIFGVAISPDGKKVVTVVGGDGAKVLDATTGQELAALPEGAEAELTFSPDGKLIAQRDKGRRNILLCSAESGDVKATLEGTRYVTSLAFSRDGKTLAAGYSDPDGAEVRLWDLTTNKVVREIAKLPASGKAEDRVFSLAFSPDGKKLAAALGSDNVAKVWDVKTGKELVTFGKHPDWVVAVAFSPDGKTVAAANAATDPQVKLWDVATGKERLTLKGPVYGLNCLAFSSDGKILAVAGKEPHEDGQPYVSAVRLWDTATGKLIDTLKSQEGHNWPQLGFARDGTLVHGGGDGVRVWEPENRPAAKKD
jgi:RNA polymerase sigma factor (sigma-70 family)